MVIFPQLVFKLILAFCDTRRAVSYDCIRFSPKKKKRFLDQYQVYPVDSKVSLVTFGQNIDRNSYKPATEKGGPIRMSYFTINEGRLYNNDLFKENPNVAYLLGVVYSDKDVDNTEFKGRAFVHLERDQKNLFVKVLLVVPNQVVIECGEAKVDGYSHTESSYLGYGQSSESTTKTFTSDVVRRIVTNHYTSTLGEGLGGLGGLGSVTVKWEKQKGIIEPVVHRVPPHPTVNAESGGEKVVTPSPVPTEKPTLPSSPTSVPDSQHSLSHRIAVLETKGGVSSQGNYIERLRMLQSAWLPSSTATQPAAILEELETYFK